jgi:hypothetical protein
MVNIQDIPHSFAASGKIGLDNNKFDGTKLPMVVCTSPNHNRWYRLSLSPESATRNSASFQPQIARLTPQSRDESVHGRQ